VSSVLGYTGTLVHCEQTGSPRQLCRCRRNPSLRASPPFPSPLNLSTFKRLPWDDLSGFRDTTAVTTAVPAAQVELERGRRVMPGMRMWRVCTGTLLASSQAAECRPRLLLAQRKTSSQLKPT
jgi:hypothetical protein